MLTLISERTSTTKSSSLSDYSVIGRWSEVRVPLCSLTSLISITLICVYHGFVASTQEVEIRLKEEKGFTTLQLVAQGTHNDKISQMKQHFSSGT